jgi:hypothetical protein
MRNAYKTAVAEPGTKRPVLKPKRRREDNIIMNLIQKQDVSVWTVFK